MTEQDAPASLKRRVEILEIGHAVLTRQQSETAVALRDIANCLQRGTSKMADVERELLVNSSTTTEVREILATARGGLRLLGFIGVAVKWATIIAGGITALVVLWQTIKNGGKPPSLPPGLP